MIAAPSLCLLLQAIASGSIAGTLRDATTNEPLAGVVVVVIDFNRTAVTDSTGRYRLDALAAGAHRLLVRRIGYTPRTLAALVPADGTVEISIALRAEPIELSAVDETELAAFSLPSDRHVDMRGTRNHPLLAEPDVFQALSGGIVAVQPESPAGMHVRGGGSDQVVYLLDGFPVFNPFHSGESFSAWNPDALVSAELQSSSETWDALSGVVTAATRPPGSLHHVQARLSTTQMGLAVDGPLGSRGGGYLWSQRSGFPGFPVPQRDATYMRGETGDRLAKIETPLAGGRARLLGYTNENELDTDGPAGTLSRNAFGWRSTTVGGEWSGTFGSASVRARAWSATGDADAAWHPDSSVQRLATRRREAGLAVTLERASTLGRTSLGIRVQTSRMGYSLPLDSGGAVRYASHAPLGAVFLERMQSISPRVTGVAAIVATGSAGAGRLSPRAAVYWSPASGLVLSTGFLRLYQFTQSLRNPESVAGTVFPVDLSVGAGAGSGVPIARGDEALVAAEYQAASGLRLRLQGYARSFRNVVLVAPRTKDPFATAPFVIGAGAARGVSVDLARATPRYALFVTYSRQRVWFSPDGGATSYTPDYAARDAVDGGMLLQSSHHLSLRLAASGRFGRRTTPLSTPFEWESCNVSDRGCQFAGSPRTNPDSLGATTLPGYVRLDIGVRTRWDVRIAGRTSELGLFGTFTNVFGRNNVLTVAPDPRTGERASVNLRSGAPLVVGLDWTF